MNMRFCANRLSVVITSQAGEVLATAHHHNRTGRRIRVRLPHTEPITMSTFADHQTGDVKVQLVFVGQPLVACHGAMNGSASVRKWEWVSHGGGSVFSVTATSSAPSGKGVMACQMKPWRQRPLT